MDMPASNVSPDRVAQMPSPPSTDATTAANGGNSGQCLDQDLESSTPHAVCMGSVLEQDFTLSFFYSRGVVPVPMQIVSYVK
jgi:hypothetical protein